MSLVKSISYAPESIRPQFPFLSEDPPSNLVRPPVSREPCPLLVPEQRQLASPFQSLGGESDGLGTVKNGLNQIGSQEGELQRARDVADIGAGAPGDGAEAQTLVGIEVVGDPACGPA